MVRVLILPAALAAFVAAAEDKAQLPEAPGKATMLKVCNNCHGAEIVLGHPRTKEGWDSVVTDMVQRGAEGTDAEFDEVVEYLVKNIKPAKVNINKATAKLIVTGTGLTEKDAAAIVKAREKAPIKTLEELKKVPGIDAVRVEAKKDQITFE